MNTQGFSMEDIRVKRPVLEDVPKLHRFFEIVVKDTFQKNQIGHLTDIIDEEIMDKKNILAEALDSHGTERNFLVAYWKGEVVATIAYGPVNEIIREHGDPSIQDLYEIGTVYVHPKLHGHGIGTFMVQGLLKQLSAIGAEVVILDSGYKTAQAMWTRKLGEPTYLWKDFWSEGDHHMVWKVSVEAFQQRMG